MCEKEILESPAKQFNINMGSLKEKSLETKVKPIKKDSLFSENFLKIYKKSV